MKKRMWYGILAVGVLMTGLIGCGTAGQAVSGSGAKAGTGTETKAGDKDPLTIYLWDTDLLTEFTPYLHEQFPDQEIEVLGGCNDTDLYSYLQEHGELPDIITVRRFSGSDARDLAPYLLDFGAYDVVSEFSSYALQYYKTEDGEINWLPVCGIPQTIIANKTLFDQYGLELPTNYQEYVQVCRTFQENGIKPYALDLQNDWSAHEMIQAGGIGELTSLEGIAWRSAAESSQGDIAFDEALWKRIFSETATLLRDSGFTEDDLSYGIDEAMDLFVSGKAAMYHGTPVNMNACQAQMDAELVRIPYFSQVSNEGFIYMNPSLNIAFRKELESDTEKLDTALQVLECMISEEGQKRIANGASVISFNPKVTSSNEGMTGLEEQIRNNEYYIRYSAQKSFAASYEAVQGLLNGSMTEDEACEAFRTVMNSRADSEVSVTLEKSYALSLNEKNGRDAASVILTTVREELGADLALVPWYYFSSSVYQGECSESRLKRMVAYTPALYQESLSGAELKTLLQTYLTDPGLYFHPGTVYELPIASGMKMRLSKNESGYTLEGLETDGGDIEDTKIYSILLTVDGITALQSLHPEKTYQQLTDTSLSYAWKNAVMNGRQPSAPEDYIEVSA